MVYQLISLAGAAMILAAFGAHQLNRMRSEGVLYQTLNLIGGVLLCITAVAGRQYGFIVLEGSWAAISGLTLIQILRRE